MILAWRERLLQLVCFFRVKYTKCVEVLGASDFELDDVFALLYLHRTCIFSSGCEKEILNFMYLLRLLIEKESGKENLNISIARLKKIAKIMSYRSNTHEMKIHIKIVTQNRKRLISKNMKLGVKIQGIFVESFCNLFIWPQGHYYLSKFHSDCLLSPPDWDEFWSIAISLSLLLGKKN